MAGEIFDAVLCRIRQLETESFIGVKPRPCRFLDCRNSDQHQRCYDKWVSACRKSIHKRYTVP